MNAKIFKKLILGLMVLSLVLPAQLAFAAERVLTVGGNTASRPITDFGINVVDEYYVDSVNGDDGRRGLSPKTAVATLDYAVSLCTANQGDIIHLMPNSDETVATAAAINIDVAGVRIVGHGDGADRPTFTFSTVDSTITFTAASTSIENVLIAPSIDSVVSAIVVSAANVSLDIEVRDKNATIECVTAILTTAAADDLTINLKYQGFIAGNACAAPIQLVGCNTARIYVDFYGEASTGVVNFITTACLDIYIRGYFFNDNVALTKNVIDTEGNGDWFVSGFDGKGGYLFTGSDAIALAASGNTGAQADVTASLEADFLDKVVAADDRTASLAYPDSVADESILAFLMSKSASPVKTSYDNTTDSLEAIRDIIDTDYTANQVDIDAILADTLSISGGTLPAAPVSGSLATYISGGSTALGQPLPASMSLTDVIGNFTGAYDGTAQAENVKASLDLAHTDLDDIIQKGGMAYVVPVTSSGGTTAFVASDLIGFGDGYFVTDWSLVVVWDAGGANAAPEGEIVDITGYTSVSGTFTMGATTQLATTDVVMVVRNELLNIAEAALPTVVAANSLGSFVASGGTGLGTQLNDSESIVDVLYGTNGIVAFPASQLPDNGVSMAEVLRETYDQADKSAVTAAAVMVNGNTIFTIANGPIEILELVSICITDNNATASTLQYSCNPTVGAATVFSGASASLTSASAGAAVVLNMTALDTAPDLVDPLVAFSAVKARGIIVNEGIITIVIGAGSTTGTWTHYLRYRPLGRGITVAGT